MDDRIIGMSSWFPTSHLGQLSLLPSARWDMSTSRGALTVFFDREGNRHNVQTGNSMPSTNRF